MTPSYLEAARLLVRIAPSILSGETFALKGGTAINLFVRDMPRLSVDLDLTYRDHKLDHKLDREAAIANITASLEQSASRLQSSK